MTFQSGKDVCANAYVKCFAPSHLKIISDQNNPASFAVLREMLGVQPTT